MNTPSVPATSFGGAETSSPQAHSLPVSIGKSPGNQIRAWHGLARLGGARQGTFSQHVAVSRRVCRTPSNGNTSTIRRTSRRMAAYSSHGDEVRPPDAIPNTSPLARPRPACRRTEATRRPARRDDISQRAVAKGSARARLRDLRGRCRRDPVPVDHSSANQSTNGGVFLSRR